MRRGGARRSWCSRWRGCSGRRFGISTKRRRSLRCSCRGKEMEATLEAVKRSDSGKNEARRHRAAGRLPAVVYGTVKEGKAPVGVPVTVDPKGLMRILRSDSGVNTLITLKLDGDATQVLVKEYQLDPITHALLHADFYQLAMDKAIVVTVPIQIRSEEHTSELQPLA